MQRLYNILSLILVLVLCFIIFRTCESKENAEAINKQNQDSLTAWRDKDGLEHAKISVLEGSISDLKKLNSSKDSTLRKLQALVDRNTSSAIVLNTTTTSKGKTKTTVSYPGKSEHSLSFKPNNEVIDTLDGAVVSDFPKEEPCPTPTYSTTINEPWLQGTITANADSITRDLKFRNEFNIVEKMEREKFWKEKTLQLEITNKNPNTTTTDLKVWRNKKPKVRRGLIFITGVVAGSIGTAVGIQQINNLLK